VLSDRFPSEPVVTGTPILSVNYSVYRGLVLSTPVYLRFVFPTGFTRLITVRYLTHFSMQFLKRHSTLNMLNENRIISLTIKLTILDGCVDVVYETSKD
jgi:hypothetical protein